MADEGEDKAAGTTPPASGEHAAKPGAGHEPTHAPAETREQTEWTASDARGPLNSADLVGADREPLPGKEPATHPDAQHLDALQADAPHAATTEPLPEQAAAAPQSPPPRKTLPGVPLVLALIVGAIIGAGSAAVINALGGVGSTDSSKVAALGARIDALEKRPDTQPEVDALKSQITARQTPAFDPAPLQQKIADLQTQLDGLKQKGAAGDPQIDSKVSALGGSVDALKAQGADVKELGGKVAALAAALDGVKKQDATAQSDLASLQGGQKSLQDQQKFLLDGQKALEAKITSAPALAVVADSLVEAIAKGKSYASQVDALGPLNADPTKVAVLKENADKGVPSAQMLAQKFTPLADTIMATATKAPPNAGLMDRLKSGMASMVSVRSAGASDGDDVGSRVSRIEADLAHDDVAGAYATWDGLPADAKTKSEAWGALAKTSVEAMDAAHALQQQAIASLGGRKS